METAATATAPSPHYTPKELGSISMGRSSRVPSIVASQPKLVTPDAKDAQPRTVIEQLKRWKGLLTTKDILDNGFLRVNRHTICRYVREGKLNANMHGNGYKFEPLELIRYLETHEM